MVEDFIKMRGHFSYNILITNKISHSTESGGVHAMNVEDIEKKELFLPNASIFSYTCKTVSK